VTFAASANSRRCLKRPKKLKRVYEAEAIPAIRLAAGKYQRGLAATARRLGQLPGNRRLEDRAGCQDL